MLDRELIRPIANEGIGINYLHGEENPKLVALKEILVLHLQFAHKKYR